MRIAVYGLGYVGLTAAACFAKEGHKVLGVDINETKIREVNKGRSPITEPGIDELLERAVRVGLLEATADAASRIDEHDLAMVCVGTPSASDGSHNISYVAEVSRQIASSIARKRERPFTVVYRSTMRPGTVEHIVKPIFQAALGAQVGAVELIYNPEFLREAVAIEDFFHPPKIVIGTHDGKPSCIMDELNSNMRAPTFYTSYGEAELTKFVDNAFHALKVSFGNEIGRVCLELGLSAAKVHEIFVADTKLNISAKYFRPGGAFGGSCLPKDIRALQHMSKEIGAHTPVFDALLPSNEAHKQFVLKYALRQVPAGGSVLMLGLAFKANSDDLRESPNVDLARMLLQSGYQLSIYDRALIPSRLLGQNLGYGAARLPELARLLVSQRELEDRFYDVVIDTAGIARELPIRAANVIDINSFP